MTKKIISLSLTIVMMLCCIALPASAAVIDEETVSPMYTYASKVTSTIKIVSKVATCISQVSGKTGVTKIVITQRLQRLEGTSWVNIQSWTKTVNSDYATFTNQSGTLVSDTYRTRTIAKVYSGTAYETIRLNSTSAIF